MDVADRSTSTDHDTLYPSPLPRNQPAPPATPSGQPVPQPPDMQLRAAAPIYHANGPTDPPKSSHHHPRWHDAKVTEVTFFKALGAVRSFPISSVASRTQIFLYTWRCTENKDRGNGKPPIRARFCMQGHLDRYKDTTIPSSPVVSFKALRTVTAAATILGWDIRTEDLKRA